MTIGIADKTSSLIGNSCYNNWLAFEANSAESNESSRSFFLKKLNSFTMASQKEGILTVLCRRLVFNIAFLWRLAVVGRNNGFLYKLGNGDNYMVGSSLM